MHFLQPTQRELMLHVEMPTCKPKCHLSQYCRLKAMAEGWRAAGCSASVSLLLSAGETHMVHACAQRQSGAASLLWNLWAPLEMS